jgi:hypothetical protein
MTLFADNNPIETLPRMRVKKASVWAESSRFGVARGPGRKNL